MNTLHARGKKKAFTLIELIIVIAIIAILAAAIFVAIDPARRLHEARNARRRSDVVTILEAVKKNQVDNDGTLISDLEAATTSSGGLFFQIGSGCIYGESDASCGNVTLEATCIDVGFQVGSGYLATLPTDPLTGSATGSSYYISVGSSKEIVVGVCASEGEGAGGAGSSPNIQVAR